MHWEINDNVWRIVLLAFCYWGFMLCNVESCYFPGRFQEECNTQTVMMEDHCKHDEACDGNNKATGAKSQSMALVVYDESILSPFHKEERTFNFNGKEVVIKQNWKDLGLAAVVWDAAVVLAEYLELNQSLVRQKRVLELGAGTGLAGIVAGLLGADISITDRKVALDNIQENVDANFVASDSHSVKVEELDWSQDLTLHQGHYDLLLGADIIYIEDTFSDLLRTLVYLANSETLVLISCKIRYERDSKFLTLLQEYFNVDKVHYDQQRDIHVYAARKHH